jgi:pilus assembly protein Flp/PilA
MTKLLSSSLVRFHKEEAGQGLVEYVMIMAFVAFAATAGMSSLASSIGSGFAKVATFLSRAIS